MKCLFSERLKQERLNLELTQTKLGEAVGLTQRQISSYENEGLYPTLENLWKLADFFDVSIDYMVGRSKEI